MDVLPFRAPGGVPVAPSRTSLSPEIAPREGREQRRRARSLLAEGQVQRNTRRKLVCQALTLDALPLSNYEFPRIPSGVVESTPLEAAVKVAVKNLELAPFLQVRQGEVFSHHAVDNSVVHAPQLWGSIAEHLTRRKADLVLLVHRLEDPAPDRVARAVPCTSNVMTGITSASQPPCSMGSFEELLRTGTAHAEYSGKVGDCCDEEVVSQVVPFTRQANRRSTHAHKHRVSFQSSSSSGKEETRYWGVVLQSKASSGDSGCYILKTTHTGVGDCTCVHWSLTRVCRGGSLFDQVTSAWLV